MRPEAAGTLMRLQVDRMTRASSMSGSRECARWLRGSYRLAQVRSARTGCPVAVAQASASFPRATAGTRFPSDLELVVNRRVNRTREIDRRVRCAR
jgi:hypothetical protein